MIRLKRTDFRTLLFGVSFASLALTGCYDPTQKATESDTSENTGVEYAPQMYHSEPYDGMTQVMDIDAGLQHWPFDSVGTLVKHGEFYNTNYYNPRNMNMRLPAEHVVYTDSRKVFIKKDQLEQADSLIQSPYKIDTVYIIEGKDTSKKVMLVGNGAQIDYGHAKELYLRYCSHCHGEKGQLQNAPLAQKVGAVNYINVKAMNRKEGYVWHVITFGKNNGSMGPHASQIESDERWMIAHYVLELANNID
jgi:hypothetical protein